MRGVVARAAAEFAVISERLRRTRPTARNLFWALERMKAVFEAHRSLPLADQQTRLVREAVEIEREDVEINERIGRHGAALVQRPAAVRR